MDVLFFAFANNKEEPLEFLRKEEEEIRELLTQGEKDGRYLLKIFPYADRAQLTQYLSEYQDSITLFHYSGHAERDRLITHEEISNSSGIAQILGQCPKLRWVVLNGCSTGDQVQQLFNPNTSEQLEVPRGVIATTAAINDRKAADFSIALYRGLKNDNDIETAYNLAKGEVQTQDSSIEFQESSSFSSSFSIDPGPIWAFFTREGFESAKEWKLPIHAQEAPVDESFEINTLLIDSLINSLAPFDRKVRNIKRDEEDNIKVDLADKRMDILNALPAPIAQQFRLLLMPQEKSSEITIERVQQLVITYRTTIELTFYILLSELWKFLETKKENNIPDSISSSLRSHFSRKAGDALRNDHFEIISTILQFLNEKGASWFVNELGEMKDAFTEGSEFHNATKDIMDISRKLETKDISNNEIPANCQSGERYLSTIISQLGFLAAYTMAAIRQINVLKPRQSNHARFSHSIVELVKLLGGLEVKNATLSSYFDTKSVIMIKKNALDNEEDTSQNHLPYLNLSPFVIDQNSFDEKFSDLTKIYFFNEFEKGSDIFFFRHIEIPDSEKLEVSQNSYPDVMEQFNAFSDKIFGQSQFSNNF